MTAIPGFIVAVLIYPGILVAFIAAWALSWVRGATRSALQGAQTPAPLGELRGWRALFDRESVIPLGVHPIAVSLATTLALVCPLLALVLLPVPGNPLASSLGLTGDLAAEGALLLGLPLARVGLGWAIPSPFTRIAADRSARLLAGAILPFVFALTAGAEALKTLGISFLPARQLAFFTGVAVALGAIAFICALPVLARITPLHEGDADAETPGAELSEISGRDLAFFRVGEALQLVACAALLTLAFLMPLMVNIIANLATSLSGLLKRADLAAGVAQGLALLIGVLVIAAGLGIWEGVSAQRRVSGERPPLTWWFGIPLLLGMAALVAAAIATRGG